MKLLLHICCAPCSVAIVDKFRKMPEIELSGFFFNPNIHPYEEYIKRRGAVERMAGEYSIRVEYEDVCNPEYWKKSLIGEKEIRCRTCYSIRLDKAARYAAENNFDAYTTSLLISPYQNHELIKSLGEEFARKYGVQFYYEDFRSIYHTGRNLSRGKGYYMQKYCGCLYSYSESDHPKKPVYNF